jgi:hypothetical protein
MSKSTQYLRHEFKAYLEKWTKAVNDNNCSDETLAEITKWGLYLEHYLDEKISLLKADFNDHTLTGEYFRSVREGFENLKQMMQSRHTLNHLIQETPKTTALIAQIKNYYNLYLVPILNTMAKLENDFIAVTTNAILEKGRLIEKLEDEIERVKKQKKSDHNEAMTKKIEGLELKKEWARLTLQHDRLNLYYFNHGRPKELTEFKKKADLVREKIITEDGVHAA